MSVDSSLIVLMNGLLRKEHVERIGMTPFRWCLRLRKALKINCELLKVMVCRWAGHDVSFRLSHQLVPFTVLDVFMTTGLGIGGLEIPFDECIEALVGEMFIGLCRNRNRDGTTILKKTLLKKRFWSRHHSLFWKTMEKNHKEKTWSTKTEIRVRESVTCGEGISTPQRLP